MTGIDRLRSYARSMDEMSVWPGGMNLLDVADQIERELRDERDRWDGDLCEAQVDWNRVAAVCLDIKHFLDNHENAGVSDMEMWIRSLRDALKSGASDVGGGEKPSCSTTPDPAGVTSEAQEVTQEDRAAAAWVREHFGLDHVMQEWRSRVPYDRYERRRQRLLGHIAECETALGRRNRRIEELCHRVSDLTRENAELRRRAMPEGMKWPTVDGRKVDFRTQYQPSLGVLEAVSIYSNGACEVMSHDGIIKPVSEIHIVVPASDGEPLEVGQTVWDTNGDELVVGALEDGGQTVTCRYADVGDGIPVHGMWSPSDLTHQRPALDSDGVLCREGDEVWEVMSHRRREIVGTHYRDYETGEPLILCDGDDAIPIPATCVTHTKPEPPDNWERIEEDAGKDPCEYFGFDGDEVCGKCPASAKNCEQTMARDLVRRAKKLAERGR